MYSRRATEVRSADDLGALDPAAIEWVRQEAWPVANTADEMYDALMVAGFIEESELAPEWPALIAQLGPRADQPQRRQRVGGGVPGAQEHDHHHSAAHHQQVQR